MSVIMTALETIGVSEYDWALDLKSQEVEAKLRDQGDNRSQGLGTPGVRDQGPKKSGTVEVQGPRGTGDHTCF